MMWSAISDNFCLRFFLFLEMSDRVKFDNCWCPLANAFRCPCASLFYSQSLFVFDVTIYFRPLKSVGLACNEGRDKIACCFWNPHHGIGAQTDHQSGKCFRCVFPLTLFCFVNLHWECSNNNFHLLTNYLKDSKHKNTIPISSELAFSSECCSLIYYRFMLLCLDLVTSKTLGIYDVIENQWKYKDFE